MVANIALLFKIACHCIPALRQVIASLRRGLPQPVRGNDLLGSIARSANDIQFLTLLHIRKAGIVSYLNLSKRLLFVHVYKNAGTSISDVLRSTFANDLAYAHPRITGIACIDKRLDSQLLRANGYFVLNALPGLERLRTLEAAANGHLSVKTFEENLPINDLESFAVVRNPWAWQVSLFNYANKNSSHFQHGQRQYESFESYIRWRCREEVRLQSHYLESHWGGIGVKHLLRFESLDHDWYLLSKKTGWPLAALPTKNKSTFDDWRSYYTDETAQLVGHAFDYDCRRFGYSFDS